MIMKTKSRQTFKQCIPRRIGARVEKGGTPCICDWMSLVPIIHQKIHRATREFLLATGMIAMEH
jgi:hypothetical protein